MTYRAYFIVLVACTFFVQSVCLAPSAFAFSEGDLTLLKKIQRDTFQYFLVHTDPEMGLTRDSSRSGAPVSIAATGFALASFGIASSHGWLSYREAYQKIEHTFNTLEHKTPKQKGFFYHFLDPKTAKRIWGSEASSIDTALLVAGALVASSYFPGTDLPQRAQHLYEQIDWDWMRNGTLLFSHGWRPENGFLPYYWDMYSEHLILQALALGSTTHPVPGAVWSEWERARDLYNGKEIVYSYTGSLFTYQYSHAFIDFRHLSDGGLNYFDNSQKATIANREFSAAHADKYESYRNQVWGLSACLGPDGYKAYGAKPGNAYHDGTVSLHAAIGSIIFTPAESMSAIRALYDYAGGRLYGTLGFKNAFNVDRDWWADEYLGVDQGMTILMLENYLRDGAIWKRFMRLPQIKRWIERTGLADQVVGT